MTHEYKIAVVGAGLAGLRLAQRLCSVADVEIFEKSRGLGGRMSTRRADEFQFDHGAQYFTARGRRFQRFLEPYLNAKTVQVWDARFGHIENGIVTYKRGSEPRYVAVPGMTALCKSMAETIEVTRNQRVEAVLRENGQWRIRFSDGTEGGGYDWVLSTAPADQSTVLLPELTDWSPLKMHGCYSLMVGFEDAVSLPFDAATVAGSPIAWIAQNNSKPGRLGASAILCQTHHNWADDWIDVDQQEVQSHLCSVLAELTDLQPRNATYLSLHRWRYAHVGQASPRPFILDLKSQAGACGDWCIEGRVEAAFDSAEALADAVLEKLRQDAA